MYEDIADVDHPLADRRVRAMVGLLGGLAVVVVSVLFLEGFLRWIGFAIGVMDALVTPYFLGKAVEGAAEPPAAEEPVE